MVNKIISIIRDCNVNKPTPIIDIAKKMGFTIKLSSNLSNNILGFILVNPDLYKTIGNNKCIVINKNIKYKERRFVLAHEIGHYLFDFNSNENIRFSHIFYSK